MNALTLAEIETKAVVLAIGRDDLQRMQLARAAELWRENARKAQIAKAVGVAPSTVNHWVRRYRELFPLRLSDQGPAAVPDSPELFEAARLSAEGMTKGRIAKSLGVERYLVECWMYKRPDLFVVREEMRGLPAEKPVQALSPPAPERADYVAGLDTLVRPARAPGEPIPLAALRETTCKWPVSGARADTLFCGVRPLAGKPYCGVHARLAYQPKTETRERTAR